MLSGITTNMDENALGLTVIEAYLGEKRRSITEKEFEVRTNQFFDSDGVGILAKLNLTDDQCVVFTRTLQGGDIIMSGRHDQPFGWAIRAGAGSCNGQDRPGSLHKWSLSALWLVQDGTAG